MGADGLLADLTVGRRNATEAADACGWPACIIQRLSAEKMMLLTHAERWPAPVSSCSQLFASTLLNQQKKKAFG